VTEAELRKMDALEADHWWFVARTALVRSWAIRHFCLGENMGRTLDIGCGTGRTLCSLPRGRLAVGTDLSPAALSICREKDIRCLVRADAACLGLADGSVDTIAALDILEHVRDDLAVLKEAHRVCQAGGVLMVTVPAFGFLWSERDEALYHLRRFSARELRNKLRAAGFEPVRMRYTMAFLFAPAFLLRLAQGWAKRGVYPATTELALPPRWLNRLLIALLALESRVLSFLPLPFGISLIAIAKKPRS